MIPQKKLSAVLLLVALVLPLGAIPVRAVPLPMTISSITVNGYQYGGATATLRAYADRDFLSSSGEFIKAGTVGGAGFFRSYACTVSGSVLSIPSITDLPTTTDSPDVPGATITMVLFDYRGTRRDFWMAGFRIPHTVASPTTWAVIRNYNNPPGIQPPPGYPTYDQVNQLINVAVGTLNDASDVVKGRTRLSVAPASSLSPIAVGDNDPRLAVTVVATDRAFAAGANAGAKIALAIASLPSTGGTVDARGFTGNQTLGAITISKPVKLLLGNANFTQTAGITVTSTALAPNYFVVQGAGRGLTTITSAAGGTIFNFSGVWNSADSLIQITDLGLYGGTGASKAVTIATGTSFNEARFIFARNLVRNFHATAVTLGTSIYYATITDNNFLDNSGATATDGASLDLGANADAFVFNNQFFAAVATVTVLGPQIKAIGGGHIYHNYFIPGEGTHAGADILITTDGNVNTSNGYLFIEDNRFSPEGEVSGRVKIQIGIAPSTEFSEYCSFSGNQFLGVSGQTAIDIATPIQAYEFEANQFSSFATVVNDHQPQASALTILSHWADSNTINSPFDASTATVTFTNGGRGFRFATVPSTAMETSFTDVLRSNETVSLQNRLRYSEGFNLDGLSVSFAWLMNPTPTIPDPNPFGFATGQLDPYGGTRAIRITRTGVSRAAFSNIKSPIDNSSGLTAWANGRYCLTFWAKSVSGTATVTAGFLNSSTGLTRVLESFNLSTTWKQYKVTAAGLPTTDSFSAVFYPSGTGAINSDMSIDLFGAQVFDTESDYVPTAGASYISTAWGNRMERGVRLKGGVAYGSLTADQITANTNNYIPQVGSANAPVAAANLRLSTDASRNLTGLTWPTTQVDGQHHTIFNVGSQNIVLVNQSASSTAANRFLNSTAADITLSANQAADLEYDSTTARWRVFKRN